jgi:hypothetical protein
MKRKQLYILFVLILIFTTCVLKCSVTHKDTIAVIGAMDEEISEIRNSLNNP